MAARYALQSFCYQDQFVTQGELHDSADAVAAGAPALFQSAPLTVGTQISPVLAGYLADNPEGP